MQPIEISKGITTALVAVAVAALVGATGNALGVLKIEANDSTKFLLSVAVVIGVVLMFRDRLSKLTLPGGIVAELSAVRKSVEDVAVATEELKSRQVEIAAPQMASQSAAGAAPSSGIVEGPPDRNNGRFGSSPAQNGLELSASVVESDLRPGWFRVELIVSGKHRELMHPVEFHLHETFPQPVQVVKPSGGEARLTVLAWGAFTVGAVADQGKTLLELDLSENSSFPREFREN